MATLGVDCNITLNGVGFYVMDGTWDREKKRLYRSRVSKSGIMHYIDKGPLFNTFKFTLGLYNNMKNFDGSANGTSSNIWRNDLWGWYNAANTPVTLVTPTNESFSCLFLDLKEHIMSYYTIASNNLEFEFDCELLQIA